MPSREDLFIKKFLEYCRIKDPSSCSDFGFCDDVNPSLLYQAIRNRHIKKYKNVRIGHLILHASFGETSFFTFTSEGVFFDSPVSQKRYYSWKELSFILPPDFSEIQDEYFNAYSFPTTIENIFYYSSIFYGAMSAVALIQGVFSVAAVIFLIIAIYAIVARRINKNKLNALTIVSDKWRGPRKVDCKKIEKLLVVGTKIYRWSLYS